MRATSSQRVYRRIAFCAALGLAIVAPLALSGGFAVANDRQEAVLAERACERIVEPQSFAPFDRTEVQCYFAGSGCSSWSGMLPADDTDDACAVRVYLRGGRVAVVTRLYLHAQSAGYQFDQHCYRIDGSLAALSTNTESADAVRMRVRVQFDRHGEEIDRVQQSFDADTGENVDGVVPDQGMAVAPYLWAAEVVANIAALDPAEAEDAVGMYHPAAGAQQRHVSIEARRLVEPRARDVLKFLKNKNFHALADFVHPVYGLQFSPEVHIDEALDVVLLAHQVRNLGVSGFAQNWSDPDTNADIIVESDFDTYYDRFIYDRDFAYAPQVGFNCAVSGSDGEGNLRDVYGDAIVAEYRFPAYTERDVARGWSSLRLVFTRHLNEWYLRGLVHNRSSSP